MTKLGIVISESIRNSVISILGIGLGFLSTVLLFPRILSAEEYGLTRVIISFSFIGMRIFGFGIYSIILRFLPEMKDRSTDGAGFFGFSMLYSFAGTMLFIFCSVLFTDAIVSLYDIKSPLFGDYFHLAVALTAGLAFFEVFASYLRSYLATSLSSFLKDVFLRILVIAELGLVYATLVSPERFFLLFTMNYFVISLILLAYLFQKYPWRWKLSAELKSTVWLKKVSGYGLFSMFSGVSVALTNNIDIMMLGSLSGLEYAAIYGVGFYFASVIVIPQTSMQKIVVPIVVEHLSNARLDEVEKLYKSTARIQLAIGLGIYVLIFVNRHMVEFLIPADYAMAFWVFAIIGLAKMVDMATGLNAAIIHTSKIFKYDLYTNFALMLLTVGTNYVLIPPYGVAGAAAATLISVFLFNLLRTLLVWKVFRIQPLSLPMLGLCVLATISILVHLLNPFSDSLIIGFLFSTAVAGGVYASGLLYSGWVPEINQLFSADRKYF